jgi:ATP-dependent exoDNAse (exonuclease V) alpha subunit
VKSVSRATGRSAPAAAAYRTATRIENQRDGLVHDYTRRGGVEDAFLVVPEGAAWAQDRSALWNAAETAEKRKDAKVAREYELALPHELNPAQRRTLARGFAQAVVARFGVVADTAIHAPHPEGDQRNWHAHVLTTTRTVTAEGMGAKTRELDVIQTAAPAVEVLRALWAVQVNQALERAQVAERVDHRSFARQGRDQVAEQHLGPAAAALERHAAAERPVPTPWGGGAERPVAKRVQLYAADDNQKLSPSEPVTRIGQHNAEVRERNRVVVLAQKAMETARERVGELEQAATQGARKVLGFARALGASIGGERRRQEEARQKQEAERVRQVEAKRVEQERQAAEQRALRERTAAEQVWAQVQAAGELARKKEAEKTQQKPEAERERPAVTQRPRGPSMGR